MNKSMREARRWGLIRKGIYNAKKLSSPQVPSYLSRYVFSFIVSTSLTGQVLGLALQATRIPTMNRVSVSHVMASTKDLEKEIDNAFNRLPEHTVDGY